MSRPKLPPSQIRVPAPMRMKPAHLAKLREVARAFGISAGEWVEAQVEPFMDAADKRANKKPSD